MHKKSLEAAETLKSSDENSDKEDEERTEISDTSSINNRRSPTTPTSTSTPAPLKTKPISNGSPCSSSISPVTMSPPITHQPPTPTQRSAEEAAKSKDYSLMSSPTSRAPAGYPHLSPHDPASNAQHQAALSHHHPHPAAHHYPLNPLNPSPDTDPEVFRWVNYNRDYPVSFIRWISVFNFLYFCPIILVYGPQAIVDHPLVRPCWLTRHHIHFSETTPSPVSAQKLKSIKRA